MRLDGSRITATSICLLTSSWKQLTVHTRTFLSTQPLYSSRGYFICHGFDVFVQRYYNTECVWKCSHIIVVWCLWWKSITSDVYCLILDEKNTTWSGWVYTISFVVHWNKKQCTESHKIELFKAFATDKGIRRQHMHIGYMIRSDSSIAWC